MSNIENNVIKSIIEKDLNKSIVEKKAAKTIIEIDRKDKKTDYKIKLHHYEDIIKNKEAIDKLEKNLTELSIVFEKIVYFDDLFIYRLDNVDSKIIEKIKKTDSMSDIKLIKPLARFAVPLTLNEEEQALEIREAVKGSDYITVGILDNGIAKVDYIKDWLEGERDSIYPEEKILKNHGTFVAGLTIYGDELLKNETVVSSGFKLLDAVIVPDASFGGIREDELILNVKKMIEKHHEKVKIWNLSVSVRKVISDDFYSDFAIVQDMLQQKYNVLICKSGGNGGSFLKNLPKFKIFEGSETISSLVVGSINEFDGASSFSRVGPGPKNTIKPDIVSYGGDAKASEDGKTIMDGVKSLSVDNKLVSSIGTSFATARVTALAATIFSKLRFGTEDYTKDFKDFNPLFLKALIINSSTSLRAKYELKKDQINELGYGSPKNSKEILEGLKNFTIKVLNSELSGLNKLDYEFSVENSIENKEKEKDFYTLTLVSNPILDYLQTEDYCHSDIDISIKCDGINVIEDKYNLDYSKEFHNVKKFIISKDAIKSKNIEISLKARYSDYILNKYENKKDELSQKFSIVFN